jgi:SAM-dependent methyltransferase
MGRAEARPFIEYLEAKRTVDDRALNQGIVSALRDALHTGVSQPKLSILEIGAGIGTMVTRLFDWQVLPSARYVAVDIDPELVKEGRRQLGRYALKNSLLPGCGLAREVILQSGDVEISVDFKCADALEYCQHEDSKNAFDLLIAHAMLDLLDLPSALPVLMASLKPSGLFYFTLVFDGITHFEPPFDPDLDAQIEELYHTTMYERMIDGKRSGDPYSGRHLLGELSVLGAEILAAGASDWLVHPISGVYPENEACFMEYILDTIEGALNGREDLDSNRFTQWLRKRRAQLADGKLIYLAHQVDVLGRRT